MTFIIINISKSTAVQTQHVLDKTAVAEVGYLRWKFEIMIMIQYSIVFIRNTALKVATMFLIILQNINDTQSTTRSTGFSQLPADKIL